LRKIITVFLLVFAVAMLIAGCGNADSSGKQLSGADGSRQVAAPSTPPASPSPDSQPTSPPAEPIYKFYTVADTQKADDGKKLSVIFQYKENKDEQIIYKAMIEVKDETQLAGGGVKTNSSAYFSYDIPLTNKSFDTVFSEHAPPITGTIGDQDIQGIITYNGKQYNYDARPGVAQTCDACRGLGYELGVGLGTTREHCAKCNGMGVIIP